MVDRLRALLDRPLDPSAARAILVFASAILVGLAGLFVLAAGQSDGPMTSTTERASSTALPPPPTPVEQAEPRPRSRHQDPQDVSGSAAARRAFRALRSHGGLQHVPYRDGELRIDLIGARGRRAVLRVGAPTVRAARWGWRRFLRRYRDSGRAYFPVFTANGGGDG